MGRDGWTDTVALGGPQRGPRGQLHSRPAAAHNARPWFLQAPFSVGGSPAALWTAFVSHRPATVTVTITTATSPAREWRVRDICDARLTGALQGHRLCSPPQTFLPNNRTAPR